MMMIDDEDDDLDDGKIRFAFIRTEKFLQRFATSFRAQLLILSRSDDKHDDYDDEGDDDDVFSYASSSTPHSCE